MSSTKVVRPTLAVPSLQAEPAFMILPGEYMTELPPSRGLGSTVVIVFALRSMTCVGTTSSEEPAWMARPSGSTNMCGYWVGLDD